MTEQMAFTSLSQKLGLLQGEGGIELTVVVRGLEG